MQQRTRLIDLAQWGAFMTKPASTPAGISSKRVYLFGAGSTDG